MQPEYDPERQLWIPGRRSFLFMAGAAVAGLFLPEHPVFAELGGDSLWSWSGPMELLVNTFDASGNGVTYRFYESSSDGFIDPAYKSLESRPWVVDKPLSLTATVPERYHGLLTDRRATL